MKLWKSCRFWLAICLILCLISGLGASAVTSNGGKVHVEKLTWLTEQGYTMSGLLYVPDNATAETPAPAVVTVHGWYNANGFQDLFNIELARRGYVVLSPDMIGHGDSEILDWDTLYDDASGINSAVSLLGTQDYVDKTRIGLTGHSSGGDQAGAALALDNEREEPLIAAILWQSSIWVDDEGVDHIGDIGSRYAGVVATQYDEFFYGDVPREFINSQDADTFLSYQGQQPLESAPEAGTYYTATIDGKETARVIYTPAITHPHEHFSTECVGYMIEFFDTALGQPIELDASNQVWPVATAFKALGLVAWIFVFITFALTMLDTKAFASLKASETVQALPHPKAAAGKLWFWVPLVACGLLNGVLFLWILHKIVQKPSITNIWPQTSSLSIGIWAVVIALISLCIFIVYYRTYGKKNGYDLRARGSLISARKFGRSVLLALLTLTVGFAVLFAVDYFFHTDFRFYLIAAHTFNSELLLISLRFVPFFLISHLITSVVINGPFYTDLASRRFRHGNLLIVIFFNVLGLLILWCAQYGYFKTTGYRLFNGTLGILIAFIWMVPVIFNIVVQYVMARTLYRKSGNPYIGALISSVLVTLIQCTGTTTVLVGLSSSSYLPM